MDVQFISFTLLRDAALLHRSSQLFFAPPRLFKTMQHCSSPYLAIASGCYSLPMLYSTALFLIHSIQIQTIPLLCCAMPWQSKTGLCPCAAKRGHAYATPNGTTPHYAIALIDYLVCKSAFSGISPLTDALEYAIIKPFFYKLGVLINKALHRKLYLAAFRYGFRACK